MAEKDEMEAGVGGEEMDEEVEDGELEGEDWVIRDVAEYPLYGESEDEVDEPLGKGTPNSEEEDNFRGEADEDWGGETSDVDSVLAAYRKMRPSQQFFQDHMNIPEPPARERLEAEAEKDHEKDPVIHSVEDKGLGELYESKTETRMYRCPSIEAYWNVGKGPEVFLYLYPGSKMISKVCRMDTTILMLKQAVGRYTKVPPTNLDIRRKRNLLVDEKTLQDLGAKPLKKIKFTVEINRRVGGDYEINMPKEKLPETARRLVSRKVKVEMEDGNVQNLTVKIQFSRTEMPMLGGFIDKRTNKKYLHAETAMEFVPKPYRPSQKSFGMQAPGKKVTEVQTLIDKAQQMERRRYYISSARDTVKYAKPYIDYEEWMRRRHEAAIIIQKYWRRHLAIKEKERRLKNLVKRVTWIEEVRLGRLKKRQEIMESEIERQLNPKHLLDLELLYRAINLWRKEQVEYVETRRWCAERKAALATITEMESDLLLRLEKVRNKINMDERENRNLATYDKMGKPTRWLSEKGKQFIQKDDLGKVKARLLKFMYQKLEQKVERTDEGKQMRCALLSKLNGLVKGFNSKLSQMLTELVCRELNYLRSPKCGPKLLVGVRRRISTTFFFLCQDPDFNPEAKKCQSVPFDNVKLREDMLKCKGCRRMRHRTEFTVVKGTTVLNRCRTCMDLYRTAILRKDLNLYRHMLKEIREEEMTVGVVNSASFLIDAFDLEYLVEQIWLGQSALSGIDNRYLLRLCRWDKTKPWSPWNCVLLTDEEATAHLYLIKLEDAYTSAFFHKVFIKQATAKAYFEGIGKLMVGLDARFTDTCNTLDQRNKKRGDATHKLQKKAKLAAIL